MKKSFCYSAIFLLNAAIFSSCSKSSLQKTDEYLINTSAEQTFNNAGAAKTAPVSLTFRVKTRLYNNDLRTYTYDGQGRIVKSVSNAYGDYACEYPNSKSMIYKFLNADGTINSQTYYSFNSSGLVVQGSAADRQFFFSYNTKNQVIKNELHITNGDVIISNYTYTKPGGNLLKIETTKNGTLYWTKNFTYYTQLQNVLCNEVYGEPYWGTESKNLVKSSNFILSDGTSFAEDYAYELDANGKVIKTIWSKNGVQQPNTIFTY